MKYVKFIIGILLFIAPITLHITPSDRFLMMTPLGYMTDFTVSGDVQFAVHSFGWYTENGRENYWSDLDNEVEVLAFEYMSKLEGFSLVVTIEGLLTILTLWGLVLYLILTIIDIGIINIVSDILMIGLAIMTLFAFLQYHDSLGSLVDFGIPIFTIVAGLIGIGGLVYTIVKWKK